MPKRQTNHVGNLESLFLRLEELVLANSGEDEFEEVFKLLIAKLWDEQSGKPGRFKAHATAAATQQVIVSLLREAERVWPGIMEAGAVPLLTAEHLHVCVEALARHTISDAGLAVMDGLFEFLVSRGAKGSKGQFFTPRHVVEFCVRMLRPRQTETVLDPACGSGGFLIHAVNFVRREEGLTLAALRKYCAAKVWGFDLDARAIRVAKALMVLAGDGSANLIRLNSLLKLDASEPTIEDVCRTRRNQQRGFDVLLTNPPFAGEVRERHLLDAYEVARGRSRVERDVLFLERCVDLLRPGGRMAIVLPHNKLAMGAWGSVRQWLLRKVRVLAVVGLGRHTFLPHTHQKAGVLFAQKYEDPPRAAAEGKVLFAVSERDGKDSRGQFLRRPGAEGEEAVWDRVDHDLGEIVGRFHDFCKAESLLAEA
jgi:type I restriction enzyme M protein